MNSRFLQVRATGQIISARDAFTTEVVIEGRVERIKRPPGWLARQTVEQLEALGLDPWTPPAPAPLEADPWAALRQARNKRLTACDWTQLPDTNLTSAEQAAWRTYRQALRDITEAETVDSVVWPEPPQDVGG